jgi:hypothetical protein
MILCCTGTMARVTRGSKARVILHIYVSRALRPMKASGKHSRIEWSL